MYYRLGDRSERKIVSLVLNLKFLGKRFGSLWLKHCTECRAQGRAVRTRLQEPLHSPWGCVRAGTVPRKRKAGETAYTVPNALCHFAYRGKNNPHTYVEK